MIPKHVPRGPRINKGALAAAGGLAMPPTRDRGPVIGEQGGLKTYRRLNPVNRERRAARYGEDFGDHAAWVRTLQDCVSFAEMYEGPGLKPYMLREDWRDLRPISEPHHTRSRGAGGHADHVVPLSPEHHREVEQWGYATFCEFYGVDLDAIAELLWSNSPAKEG